MTDRIMQGGVDCGPKDEEMTEIEKLAKEICKHTDDLIAERLELTSNADELITAIVQCAKSIQHRTNYEHKCTTCSLSGLMLAGLESRNDCIKRLHGEVAVLEKVSCKDANELGTRFLRIKELEEQLKQRSEA